VKMFLRDRSATAPRGSRHLPDAGKATPAYFNLIAPGGIAAGDAEVVRNPRARSARLRVAERTETRAAA